MDTVLLSVRCSDGKEISRCDTSYGSLPAHSVAPAAEGIIPAGMAGVHIQFRMELAASDERTWTCSDPWKYVSCLPGPQGWKDLFKVSETPPLTPVSTKGKGKRPVESEGDRGESPGKPATNKARKELCRLHNTALGGCPNGNECIFLHRCSNCGAADDHGQAACRLPPKPSP